MRRWSKQDETKLKKLYSSSISMNKLSNILNRSKRAIIEKAMRLNLKRIKNIPIILSPYERGFIEGFLDADGCITLGSYGKNRRTPRFNVSFSNNSVDILNKIQKILGINKSLVLKETGSFKNYQFALSPKESYALLKQITLVVKEHRRKIGIECYEYIQACGGASMNDHTRPKDYDSKISEFLDKFHGK